MVLLLGEQVNMAQMEQEVPEYFRYFEEAVTGRTTSEKTDASTKTAQNQTERDLFGCETP